MQSPFEKKPQLDSDQGRPVHGVPCLSPNPKQTGVVNRWVDGL